MRDAPGVSSRSLAPRQHSARTGGVMPPLRAVRQTLLQLVTDMVASGSPVSVVPTQEDRIRSLVCEASMEMPGAKVTLGGRLGWARGEPPGSQTSRLVFGGADATAPSVAPGTDAFRGRRRSAQVAPGLDSASAGRAEVKQDLPDGGGIMDGGDQAHAAPTAITKAPCMRGGRAPVAWSASFPAASEARARAAALPDAVVGSGAATVSPKVFRIKSNGQLNGTKLIRTPTPVDVEFGLLA